MHVRDLMTTDVIAVAPTTSIRDAARMMFRYRVSGLPVVDREGHYSALSISISPVQSALAYSV